MRPKDLRFICEIDGKKPQLVFEQDETYFVMTSMDDDERGNFIAISSWETEQVLREVDKLGGQLFHPREVNLFRYISEASYRESRIRAICYVLVAQKQMMHEKVGREIQFRSWREYGYRSKPSASPKRSSREKPVQPATGPYWSQEFDYYEKKLEQSLPNQLVSGHPEALYQTCQRCGAKVGAKKWKKHDSVRCPKLKGDR